MCYLESFGQEIILHGDKNCDILETADPSGPFSSQSRHMTNIYDYFGFKQLISEPTRETVSTKTLIDQIATTNPNNIVDSGVVQLAISDHYLTNCVKKFMSNLSKVLKVFESRQMKNFDKEKFTADLSQFYWDDLVDFDDPNIVVQMCANIFVATIDKHAPIKKRKGKNVCAPWITSELIQKQHIRDILKSKTVKLRSDMPMEAHKNMRNQVNQLNRHLKREYFTKTINKAEGNIKTHGRLLTI